MRDDRVNINTAERVARLAIMAEDVLAKITDDSPSRRLFKDFRSINSHIDRVETLLERAMYGLDAILDEQQRGTYRSIDEQKIEIARVKSGGVRKTTAHFVGTVYNVYCAGPANDAFSITKDAMRWLGDVEFEGKFWAVECTTLGDGDPTDSSRRVWRVAQA